MQDKDVSILKDPSIISDHSEVSKVTWEAMYEEYRRGATFEMISGVFNVSTSVIRRHAEVYKWEELAANARKQSAITVRRQEIEKSRLSALNNCHKIEKCVDSALEDLLTVNIDATSMKQQAQRIHLIHGIAKVVDIVTDIRARVLGDDAAAKDTGSKTQINIMLPKIMQVARGQRADAKVINITDGDTKVENE
jgi:hypothetical protein